MIKTITAMILTVVFTTSSYAGFEGPGATLMVVSVSSINELDDDDEVILEGYIVKKVQKERYLFKDKTGEVKVEIDDKLLRNLTVTPETLLRIKGEVDSDWFTIEVDVDNVEIVERATSNP